MAFLTGYLLIRDSTTLGIKPFGSFNNIVAQVANAVGIKTKSINTTNNNIQVIDSYGRCLVLNPNSSKPVQRLADSGIGSGREIKTIAGLNQGVGVDDWNSQIDFIEQKELGMSYLLGLVTSPSQVIGTVNFIKGVADAGMMPIVRLCYSGGCEFNISGSADPIIKFYQQINEQLQGTDYNYIGVVGPNEPGTANEMQGFGVSDYGTLVNRANEAATALQDDRVTNGGNMYIAPVIFNIVNRQNDDVKEYLLDGSEIDPGLFDYLLGNTYNLLGQANAYTWYQESGLKNYVDSTDLYVVITEFGSIGDGASLNVQNLNTAYQQLCNDEKIDGILFFRPFNSELPISEPRQDPEISSSVISNLIDSCDKQPQKVNSLNSKWLNCNFDSCISPQYTYTTRSVAQPVAQYTPDQSSKKAWLQVNCNGNSCSAGQQNTMQISLPIKALASTTATNSSNYKKYPPSCVSLAKQYGEAFYDVLNQFAGVLTTSTARSLSNNTSSNNTYDGKSPLDAQINIISDSQGAPGPERGTFLPSEWFSNVERSGAIPGSSAEGFSNGQFGIPSTINANSNVVLWLGTNDCPAFSPEEFRADIRTILSRINASTKVYILPIPYRTDGQCNDSKVNEYNSVLRSFGGGNVTFVNLQFDPQNKSAYLYSDGLHVANYRPINEAIYNAISGNGNSEVNITDNSIGSLTSAPVTNAYPMPWLGSLFNCISELSLAGVDFASELSTPALNPHPFSIRSEAIKETESDLARKLALPLADSLDFQTITENGTDYIPEEKTVCVKTESGKEECFDNSSIELLSGLEAYTPFALKPSYYSMEKSDGKSLVYLKNADDLLPGPEVKTIDKSIDISGSELCWRYGQRKNHQDTKDNYKFGVMGCEINTFVLVGIPACNTLPRRLDSWVAFQNGTAYLPESVKNCFTYRSGKVQVATTNYGSFQSYDIQGAYDALYRSYQMIQNQMSSRLLQVVFKQDVGWQSKQELIIRDKNKPVSLGDYLYVGEYNTNSCLPVRFFENNFAKASGSSSKVKYEYYSWLGYLDLIQEWTSTYTLNSNLKSEEFINNPFYGTDSSKPNYNKSLILKTAEASKYQSYPLMSCDEVNICRKYSRSELIDQFKGMQQYSTYSQDQLYKLANSYCPFNDKLPTDQEFTCIDTIKSSEQDNLKVALCQKGYSIDGTCSIACIPPSGNEDFSLIYPTYSTNLSDVYGRKRLFRDQTGKEVSDIHTGLDFGVPTGTEVHASAAGQIVAIGDNPATGYGLYVKIKHDNGFATVYGHNSRVLVSLGAYVAQGDVIALSGSTGLSTAPHVHFELRKNETCEYDGSIAANNLGTCSMDPTPYFSAVVEGAQSSVAQNATGPVPTRIGSGGAIFEASVSDVTINASLPNELRNKSINDYVNATQSDIVINTNFSDGTGLVDGLYGGNNQIEYRDLRSLDYALVYKSGNIRSGNNEWDKRIFAEAGNFAIIDISQTTGFGTFTTENINYLKSRLTWAVSGLAVIANNGEMMSDQMISAYANFSEFTSRTIIGWKNGGQNIVVAVIDNADLRKLSQIAANELNLDYAISLDGGGSSQMYYRGTFTDQVPQEDLYFDKTVYWPATNRSEENPRFVPNFLGIKLNNGVNGNGGTSNTIQCYNEQVNGQRGDVPDGTTFTPGKLSCNLNVNNTGDYVDFTNAARYLDVYIRSYNLDSNQSYTWIANPDVQEGDSLRQALINKLGESGYLADRNQRLEVTNFVINKARTLGINPRFVFTLWLEETGGSAVGGHALGCGVRFLPEIPYGQGKDAMINHMEEQLECLYGMVVKSGNFNDFMCTYSGEPATDGTATVCDRRLTAEELGTIRSDGVRTCNINNFICNPNFPAKICEIYDQL